MLTALGVFSSTACAQDWMRIHRTYDGATWSFPLNIEKTYDFELSNKGETLKALTPWNDGIFTIPYTTELVDSIDFANSLTDDEKGHNKYRPFTMNITTENATGVKERNTWVNCHISIDGKGEYSDFSGTGRIRGRGNSSWEWYDKKPYKFKLDSKSKILGLEKAKDWNLLANYRDVTDMMNVFAFETARYLNMPNTNHTRFVEVFLDQKYIGLYQLTEKIEVGRNRVDIDEEEGVMISFDQDDGPSLSPDETDNFMSEVYQLPICIKHPENPDAEKLAAVKADFAKVEKAVKAHDYEALDSLVDVASLIGILQMHEYLYNVEIDAPRSIYAYKDKGGKYVFGPTWDWDAAFDFDWSDMYTGHAYFSNYKELIYGTDPVKGTGAAYNINKFWRNMFDSRPFVTEYKKAWSEKSDSMFLAPWEETSKYVDALTAEGSYNRETKKWPATSTANSGWQWGSTSTTKYDPATEITKMGEWLKKRKRYLDGIIASYPAGKDVAEEIVDANDIKVVQTISKEQECSLSGGYSQNGKIHIDAASVESALGGEPTELVPLNADGTEGGNTAAKVYGAWFDSDGNTVLWGGDTQVYIESDDLYSWAFGCHPYNGYYGESIEVTMQYRRGRKAVNVVVKFKIK